MILSTYHGFINIQSHCKSRKYCIIKLYKKNLESSKNEETHKADVQSFLCGLAVKNPPVKAGDMGLPPHPGRFCVPQSN